ncbi:hypothetical protein RRG08_054209 [Elysia crispata]|uniref:Uncharacterized protein n=1 Tax=Elysia crispata TaxID=231223 RepID=A0AAE0YCU2_9GAST|nr:hypothetical protein RRG08_054209 [Elysia crispata]
MNNYKTKYDRLIATNLELHWLKGQQRISPKVYKSLPYSLRVSSLRSPSIPPYGLLVSPR